MTMISSLLMLEIAGSLVELGVWDVTMPPQELILHFQYYDSKMVPNISRTLNKSENEIKQFFDHALPCMIDITYTAIEENKINQTQAILDEIWVECLVVKPAKLVPKIPNWQERCPNTIHDKSKAEIFIAMAALGYISIFVFIFIRKRTKCFTGCCWGRPGPVVALNMLDSYENRFGYAFCFGLTAYQCIEVVMGRYGAIITPEVAKYVEETTPKYLSIFIQLWITLLLSSVTYPLFIFMSMKNKLMGSLFGLVFSVLWFVLILWKRISTGIKCDERWKREKTKNYLHWLMILPEVAQLTCLAFLIGKFSHVLFLTMQHRMKLKGIDICGFRSLVLHDDTDWRKQYFYQYVYNLLNRKRKEIDDDEDEESEGFNIKQLFKSKLYQSNPDFKYSTRIIITTIVSSLAIYVMVTKLMIEGYMIFVRFWDDIFQEEVIVSISEWLNVSIQDVKDYVGAVAVSYWVGIALALVFYIFTILNSFAWYRKHIMMLRKGDRAFLPNSVKKQSLDTSMLMVASVKFAGFQVAYIIWGFLITAIIMFLITLVIITQLFLPMKRGKLSFSLELILDFWPSLIIGMVIMILQRLMAIYCWIQDENTLAVNNRRAFHIASYFMFYFNLFLGIASCLLRIVIGAILGVIFLSRLQKSTLPRSFERRDPGYLSYLGYLLLEHQHANPILQVFTALIQEINEMKQKACKDKVVAPFEEFFRVKSDRSENNTIAMNTTSENWEKKFQIYRANRLRNKWHLYKTLVLNPSLVKYRCKPKKFRSIGIEKALFSVATIDINATFDNPVMEINEEIIDLKIENDKKIKSEDSRKKLDHKIS